MMKKKTQRRSFAKYKQEFGKTCNTGAVTTIIAALVTPKVTGQVIGSTDLVILAIIAIGFWLAGFILLSEKQSEPKGDGKWKRVRVKKDTTIHVMEEETE